MDFRSTDSSLPDRWRRWAQTMQLYLDLAFNDKAEKEKCSLFLYVIGQDGRDIYNNNLTFTEEEENKVAPLFTKFQAYCNPKQNVTMERNKFFSRLQAQSESIDQYVTELRTIARNCGFDTRMDEFLRDQLVLGTNSDRVKERLLREDDLTLDRAIAISRADEESKKHLKHLSAETSVHGMNLKQQKQGQQRQAQGQSKQHKTRLKQATSGFNKKGSSEQTATSANPSTEKSKCGNCGFGHARKKCPAFGQQCFNCGKMNHFKHVCRQARRVHTLEQPATNTSTRAPTEPETLFIETITTEIRGNECFSTQKVEGHYITFKIDTGSQANILPVDEYYKIKGGTELQKSTAKLTSFTGDTLPVMGTCQLKCQDQLLDFFVANTNQPPILGLKSSQDLELIQIHNMQLESTVRQFPTVFTGLGHLQPAYHVKLDPNVPPVVSPSKRIPATLRDKLRLKLSQMEKQEVIRKVDEPTDWVSSLAIVDKPNTNDLRICLDPKHLNEAIKREHFQLPTIEEITTRMAGATKFTKLDANSGYWQIPLDTESQLLTTFSTPFGRYCFLRMPFGIKSAQEVFQKRISQNFGDLPGVETNIDDIIIWGNDDNHDERVRKALERCKRINLTLNLQKCEFGKNSVKYLGHILSADGVKPDPSKSEAIQKMPAPRDRKGVQRLMGTVNYLAKFVPEMSTKTAPIRELLKHDVNFQWEKPQEDALKKIKHVLTSQPVLVFFDVKKPVTISCDASKSGLGAVLLQEERPVAYASRSLTNTEVRYAQIEKELLAVVFALERFHEYTYGQQVTVQSDHKPLESIVKKPLAEAPPRLQRMLLRLQKYDFKLIYTPGKYLTVADTLSRAHPKDTDSTGNMDTELEQFVHSVLSTLPVSDSRLEQIRKLTAEDASLQTLCGLIIDGWPQERRKVSKTVQDFWHVRDELCILEGIVFKGDKIFIPHALRREMLQKIHEGHMGMEKSKRLARDVMFWPTMGSQISDMVSSCGTCLAHRNSNQKEPMIPSKIPSLPWEIAATDLFLWNEQNYLVVVDYYSRFFEVAKLENTKSATVITHTKAIFARHGIPVEVRSDNGPQFVSHEYEQFAKSWEFKHITTSPYHSQANGLAEKTVQITKRILTKCHQSGTDPYLGLLQYRNTPIDDIGSPAQIAMSRRLRSTLPVRPDLLQPNLINPQTIHEKLRLKQQKQKTQYDQHSKQLPSLHAGEAVRIQHHGSWKPAIVSEPADTPRSYHVETPEGVRYRRNRKHLLKTNETPPDHPMDVEVSAQSPAVTDEPEPLLPGTQTVSPATHQKRTSGRTTRKPSWLKDYVI